MGLSSIKACSILISELKKECGKNRSTQTPVIVGGHGATMQPEPLLVAGADLVVSGEGEDTLKEILKEGISENIQGTIKLKNGLLHIAPKRNLIRPLDNLKMPAYDMMCAPQDGVYLMETSRGCPHSCNFCETTRFSGRIWRPKSPEKVANEVHYLVDEIDARIIQIGDDNFTANPRRVIKICETIQKGPLPMLFMASARADDLISDADLIPGLAAANFFRVTIGVETLDVSLANHIGKKISAETYKKAFKALKEHGIFSTASFIVGLPGESKKNREEMVDMAIQTGADAAHFIPFTPHPNTPFGENVREYVPKDKDIADSEKFGQSFRKHPSTIKSLQKAVSKGGMRGVFARAVLEK
jgi:radical SAM superfamily enzyme YgiQ (UPF0313 family)